MKNLLISKSIKNMNGVELKYNLSNSDMKYSGFSIKLFDNIV